MRIAINSPIWVRVPPVRYGGIEMIIHILTDELVKMGHDVTVYASGDSIVNAKLKHVYDEPEGNRIHLSIPEMLHGVQAYKEADNYDLIHDHTNCGPVFAGFVKTPVLVTLHGDFNDDTRRFYSNFAFDAYYNSISDYQRQCFPDLNYVGTVYNAINIDEYEFKKNKDDFLLSLSRICFQKGTHLAIEAALKSGNRLMITGKIDSGLDRAYFKEKVEPLIDDENIVYLGETSNDEKKDLLAKAKCLLFPIQWAEPFGLVMVEAMASGTPVIALRNGSVPEVVEDGVTGFIVDDIDGLIESIWKLDQISPNDCRERVVKNFSPEKMAQEYLKLYKMIIEKSKR